jgi:deaminated glutathione amidase
MCKIKIGLVQLNTHQDVDLNYEAFKYNLRLASEKGADFIATPEVSNLITDDHNKRLQYAAVGETDRFIAFAKELAHEKRVHILIGSLAFRIQNSEKCRNRSFLITPDGYVSAYYDKVHMFDVRLSQNEIYEESAFYERGSKSTFMDVEFGRIGMTICYDVRFPNLYTHLALNGANIITVPSAFTKNTGEKHWEVLLRSRAIETGAFIVAPAQTGKHGNLNRISHGNSMVVSPSGEVLLNLGTDPGVGLVEIDLSQTDEYRQKIPNLRNIVNFS